MASLISALCFVLCALLGAWWANVEPGGEQSVPPRGSGWVRSRDHVATGTGSARLVSKGSRKLPRPAWHRQLADFRIRIDLVLLNRMDRDSKSDIRRRTMMFNNLIESSSHRKEFKRRGSFVLCTTITYALMLGASGLVSIYAYDAHLEAQTTELELVMFVPPDEAKTSREVEHTVRPTLTNTPKVPGDSVRTKLVDSTFNPNNVPDNVGTEASTVPPALPTSRLGSFNSNDLVLPNSMGHSTGTGDGNGRPNVVIADPPPPPPDPPQPPKNKVVKKSVLLNSEALSLPKPKYPPLAIQIHLEGVVNVQVLIDETGRVVSAKAVNGHPMLVAEAVRAANQAKFSPTILGDQPVKVSGMISYNFKLNR